MPTKIIGKALKERFEREKCPKCGSFNVHRRIKTKDLVCWKCGYDESEYDR